MQISAAQIEDAFRESNHVNTLENCILTGSCYIRVMLPSVFHELIEMRCVIAL